MLITKEYVALYIFKTFKLILLDSLLQGMSLILKKFFFLSNIFRYESAIVTYWFKCYGLDRFIPVENVVLYEHTKCSGGASLWDDGEDFGFEAKYGYGQGKKWFYFYFQDNY